MLGSGTVAVQAVGFLFSPLITRLYGPEVYGLLGSYMALATSLLPLVSFTFPVAVVMIRSARDAVGLAKLSLWLTLLCCVLLTLTLLMWGNALFALLGLQAIQAYGWLLPLTVFMLVAQQLAEQWLLRQQRFGLMAGVGVGHAFVFGTAKSVMGLFYPFAWMLIVLNTLSSALYLLWVGLCLRQPEVWKNRPRHRAASLFVLARRYCDFPLFRMPDALVYAVGQSAPALSLAALSGAQSAGFFVLARSVLAFPVRLLGKSSGDVFYPEVSQAINAGLPLWPLLRRHLLFLFVTGALPFGIVAGWGPLLFGWVFGAGWNDAGEYARWLALLMFTTMLNIPVVRLATVLRLQAGLLCFTCISTLLTLAALYWGYESGGELRAIQGFCLSGALMNLLFMLVIVERCLRRERGVC